MEDDEMVRLNKNNIIYRHTLPTSSFNLTSSNSYDTLLILGQNSGKFIIDIIMIIPAIGAIKHLGDYTSITASDFTTNSCKISSTAYTAGYILSKNDIQIDVIQ